MRIKYTRGTEKKVSVMKQWGKKKKDGKDDGTMKLNI